MSLKGAVRHFKLTSEPIYTEDTETQQFKMAQFESVIIQLNLTHEFLFTPKLCSIDVLICKIFPCCNYLD